VWKTYRTAPLVETDDPWGYGGSLEWATSCPPPRHNFVSIPRIRSERPAFDLHHPEAALYDTPAPDKNVLNDLLGPAELTPADPGDLGAVPSEESTTGADDEKGDDRR